jgi:tetratricopeptide (TPR) repeat protein|tara:strand:- start:2596 stop:3822 length:1227 start_codon:yes stop_codon:yes gene_type:complete
MSIDDSTSFFDIKVKLDEALSCFGSNNFIETLRIYDLILKHDSDNITALYSKGVTYSKMGESEKAVISFKQVNKLYPNHPPTVANLAVLLEELNVQEAVDFANIAAISYPDLEAINRISKLLENNLIQDDTGPLLISNPVAEENHYNQESDDDLLNLLSDYITEEIDEIKAQRLLDNGDYIESVKLWKKILENKPQSSEIWLGLSNALISAGYLEKGQQCLERSKILTNAVEESFVHGEINNGEVNDEDNARLRRASELETENKKIYNDKVNTSIEWFNKGTNFLSEGKSIDSISCFEKAIGGCPQEEIELRVRSQNGRGDALYNLSKYSESILAYHAAISLDPNLLTGRTLYNMGQSYAFLELYDDGLKCFEQAINRGLEQDGIELCKTQINRCKILLREQKKRLSK